jgi:hypothetical protein
MSRRRSNMGHCTSSAKIVRLSRRNKNDQCRDVRFLLDRERHVSQRAQELSLNPTVSLSLEHGRQVAQRTRESSVDRTVSLSLERESHVSQI